MSEEVMTVSSEINPYFDRDLKTQPCCCSTNVISKFRFTCPENSNAASQFISSKKGKNGITVDEDGDYQVVRKNQSQLKELSVVLEHSTSTELKLVGLQIWRGALLLADFVIHNQHLFKYQTVLEVGAGVGLTSIVAAMFADQLICTDLDVGDILKLIKSNAQRNKHLVNGKFSVVGLDFFKTDWSSSLEQHIKDASIILAADVVYDNDVTDAFITTLIKILSLSSGKIVYIALEKRYVFTITDLDSVAPCYEHLLQNLRQRLTKELPTCTMVPVDIDFPQYFNYERVKQILNHLSEHEKFSSAI